jgi:hypothetical protein
MRPLNDTEVELIVHKCGFAYMRENRNAFEMNPPHLLQTDAELFVRGTADRHKDVPTDMRQRIVAWCTEKMQANDVPLGLLYPE